MFLVWFQYVHKKDGSLRIRVDYRALNRDTVAERYPIPTIDDLIDAVGNRKGKWFTSLDLTKGYHQVQMAADSKIKTAFACQMNGILCSFIWMTSWWFPLQWRSISLM